METTVQSNTVAFPQSTQLRRRKSPPQPIPSDQEAGVRLHLSNTLQSTLEIERVLELFLKETKKIISVDQLIYSNPRIGSDIQLGKKSRHQCEYQLTTDNETLGTLSFTRNVRFIETELTTLELLIGCLILPLRNALMYREAMQCALEDPLTGTGNRLALEKHLEREVKLSLRHRQPLSVIVVDVDRFKDVNDTHGHTAGDIVLKNVAQKLSACCRGSDSAYRAYRFGGEEFVMVLNNTDTQGAKIVAERIRTSIQKMATEFEQDLISVTASIGISSLLSDDNISRLFQRADKALYKAKNSGRNKIFTAAQLKLEPIEHLIG